MKVLITGGTNGMGKGVAKILAGVDNQLHEVLFCADPKNSVRPQSKKSKILPIIKRFRLSFVTLLNSVMFEMPS